MAAYYKVEVSLNTNSVTVGSPSAQEVLVTLPLVGPAGATGATGATGASGQGVPVGGTTGQVLSKASGTNYDTEWVEQTGGGGDFSSPPPIGDVVPNTGAFTTISASGLATLPHIHGSLAGNLYIHVKNTSGGALSRGTPVYVVGNVGATDRVEVAPADFDDVNKMPAVGLLDQDLAHNGTGDAIIVGELASANTAAYALAQELFVGNAGTITGSRPTTGEIQSIGTVARVQSSTGVIVVNMQARRSPLAAVAISGDYDDLSDKPTIPTASTTTPAALGTAAVGTGTTFARADHVHAMPTAANVGAAQAVTDIELTPDATTTITTAQLPARGIAYSDGEATFTVNLPTPDIRQSGLTFSIKSQYEAGSGPNFITVVHAAVNLLTAYELDEDEGSIDFLWDGYAWTYDSAYRLRSFPGRVLQLPAGSGTLALTSDFCEFIVACSDESTNLTTGTAKVTFRAPYAFTLTAVRASVNTAPTGSTLIVDINEGGTTVLSTKLSIDASEKTSTTAASAAVISDSAIADDAEITIDIDQIGSTIAGKGLKVTLIGTRA